MKIKSLLNPRVTLDWLKSTASGKGVEIAVLDSGIDTKHPDLIGKISRSCYIAGNTATGFSCQEQPVEKSLDAFGHGSAVAGIIASIAPAAFFADVKVLDATNQGNGKALLTGLQWALDQKIKLINLSLSTSKREFLLDLHDLCEQAFRQNAIIVTARRNIPQIGIAGDIGYYGCPAHFSSVVSVERGEIEQLQNRMDYRFNNNSVIRYSANGSAVTVPKPGGGYVKMTGNSFATPCITGICALIIELYPDITPFELNMVLKNIK